jgi:aryl-alcohol dehydrogenase-like predicted oxidoreductase
MQDELKQHLTKLKAFETLCRRWEEKAADVALAWVLHNPIVTAPIIGPRTREQLDGCLRALKIKFTKTSGEELDRIFPALAVKRRKRMRGEQQSDMLCRTLRMRYTLTSICS